MAITGQKPGSECIAGTSCVDDFVHRNRVASKIFGTVICTAAVSTQRHDKQFRMFFGEQADLLNGFLIF